MINIELSKFTNCKIFKLIVGFYTQPTMTKTIWDLQVLRENLHDTEYGGVIDLRFYLIQ